MPTREDRSNGTVESQTYRHVRIRDICRSIYWCKVKSSFGLYVFVEFWNIYYKWWYITTRPPRFVANNSAIDKMVHPYTFASVLACLLFMWYGALKEEIWATRMYRVYNIIQIIVCYLLLLAELTAVCMYGDDVAWYRKVDPVARTVYANITIMLCLSLWHLAAIIAAVTLQLIIRDKVCMLYQQVSSGWTYSMVCAARAAMRAALLLCLLIGLQARSQVEQKGHAKLLKNHGVNKPHKHQVKKLFLVPAIVGVFNVIGHLATVLTVVDVATSIWDRMKPTEHVEYEQVEEDYDDDRRHF